MSNFGKAFSFLLCAGIFCLHIDAVDCLCYSIKAFTIPQGKSLFLYEKEKNELVWNSTDESVVKVDNGAVLSLKEGEALVVTESAVSDSNSGKGDDRYVVRVTSPELLKSVAYIAELGLVSFFLITSKSVSDLKIVLNINKKKFELTGKGAVCVEDGEGLYWEIPVNLNSIPAGKFKADIFVYDGTTWRNEKNSKICGFFSGTGEDCKFVPTEKCVSKKLVDFIIEWEGFVPRLVVDCLVPGVYNIGYGDVISFGESFYNNITKRQGFVNFVNKLNFGEYVRDVNKFIINNNVKCTQSQFDALVSFSYNLGTVWLKNSRLKEVFLSAREPGTNCVNFSYFNPELHPENIELYYNLVREFLLYHHVLNPRRCIPGLLYRRISELNMFFFGEYSKNNGKLNLHNYKIPECVSFVL